MSALDTALHYIQRGWNPVPIPHRQKRPLDDAWQRRVIDEPAAPQFFNGHPQNIGVVLGPTSAGLTDVDLDCEEAIELAPYLLPHTDAIFGRRSKPASHWLYVTDLGQTSPQSRFVFKEPAGRATILELRVGGGKGAQTVFPGSTHESGEPIEWVKAGEPARVDGAELRSRIAAMAAAVLLVRAWPVDGGRHDAALILGGFLARAGWKVASIVHFVGTVASVAGDDETPDRKKAAEDQAKAFARGERAYGFPALAECFSDPVARRVAEWLDYHEPQQAERETPTGSQPRPQLSTVDITRWFEQPAPPVRFVVDRIIPRGMVTILSGDGGAGKSLLTQQLLTSVAAGYPFLGMATEQGAAAGVFCEDPDSILHSRQRRVVEALKVPNGADLAPRLRIASYLGCDPVLWRDGKPTPFFHELEVDLGKIPGLSLAGIDSASLVFAGNENDRTQVAGFMMALNGMADRLQIAIVLLGHTSKTQSDDASGMASGSTSWVWQARSALRLKVSKEGVPVLSHPKANHAKKIDAMELTWSENGVLLPTGVVQFQLPPKDVLRKALQAIREAWDAGKPWSSYIQAKKTGTYAPERISREFGIEARIADYLIREWLNNDVLSVETIDPRNKRSGLKVTGWIE